MMLSTTYDNFIAHCRCLFAHHNRTHLPFVNLLTFESESAAHIQFVDVLPLRSPVRVILMSTGCCGCVSCFAQVSLRASLTANAYVAFHNSIFLQYLVFICCRVS
jgi:hypothetical protein